MLTLVVKATVFPSSSHQLYGDPNHHLLINQAGVQYLSNNPECCTESNTDNSCNEYINSMSMQGTWCDALFVLFIESHENFARETLREPHYLAQHPPTTI